LTLDDDTGVVTGGEEGCGGWAPLDGGGDGEVSHDIIVALR
jgi:hypothetical protein